MHIRFESPIDLEEFMAELLQLKLIELTPNKKEQEAKAENLTKQLLIADDGHTYLLHRIKNLTDVEAAKFSHLRFSTRDGKKITFAEVRKANEQQLKSLIHNKALAEMLCSANPNMHYLGMTIPESAILLFPLIYPVTVPTEHAIEYSAIEKDVFIRGKNPISNLSMSIEQLLPNIALSDLLLLNYNYLLEVKIKTANRKIDPARLEKLNEIIEDLEKSLEVQREAFPGIKHKERLRENPALGNKEELLSLENKIKENNQQFYRIIITAFSKLIMTFLVFLSPFFYGGTIVSSVLPPIKRAISDIVGETVSILLLGTLLTAGLFSSAKKMLTYFSERFVSDAVKPIYHNYDEGKRLVKLQSEFRTTHFYCMNKEFLDATFEKVQTLEKKLIAIKNTEPKDKAVPETNASQLLPPTASLLRHASNSPAPLRLIPSPSTQRDEDFQPKSANP